MCALAEQLTRGNLCEMKMMYACMNMIFHINMAMNISMSMSMNISMNRFDHENECGHEYEYEYDLIRVWICRKT